MLYISPRIQRLIDMAIDEDEVGFDVASAVFFAHDRSAPTEVDARLVAKQDLTLSGLAMVEAVFARVDPAVTWDFAFGDGRQVESGQIIGRATGRAISMLRAERIALNFLQRMSGIATKTARYVAALGDSPTRIVDTRKTLPGYRELDKYAVRCGGGANHRFNLSGGVMLKDNHIAAASGSIADAVRMVREQAPMTLKVEIEVTDFDELQQALEAGADVIMLDNMSTRMMSEAVRKVREFSSAGGSEHNSHRHIVLEASGNITLERLPELADIGLDYISSGALTHSVEAADISLKF
jgi:nicotinate-nucleotide pyrophosphorylase (carboxylating)